MAKTTYRNAKKERFTPISNSLLWDKEVTLQAKGLLSIFLSNSNDWELNMKEIINRSKNGRDAHYKIVNELIELGYFARVQVMDPIKKQFEEMIYIFSDIKQEVADELENIKQWSVANGKDLTIEYKINKKDKKEPLPGNQDADKKPLPENQDAENKDAENQYINNTKENNTKENNTNTEEDEEEERPLSDLILFLLTKNITLENAVKFENRLIESNLTGYTKDQCLDAIDLSLLDFEKGIADEPYIWAVGKLERLLDGRLNVVKNKPKKANLTKGRKEGVVPDWLAEHQRQQQEEDRKREEEQNKKVSAEELAERRAKLKKRLASEPAVDFEAERQKILQKLKG